MTKNRAILAIMAALVSFNTWAFVPATSAASWRNQEIVGPWSVTDLATDSAGRTIESYKVDRDLVAWTEVTNDGYRYLRASVGTNSVATLVTLSKDQWQGDGAFYDPIAGNYDAADGFVVWSANDGYDKEIYMWHNGVTTQLTSNTYDDIHPITSEGRIAWTANRSSDLYTFMYRGLLGQVEQIDQYHVMNYKFSGYSLYWLNTCAGQLKVKRFNGSGTPDALGPADSVPNQNYLVVDDKGGVAWVYSANHWNSGRRVFYVVDPGKLEARKVLEREVPPTQVRLEDLRGGTVLVNSNDLITKLTDHVTLIHANGSWESVVAVKPTMIKARFTDDAHVRHNLPETGSPLYVRHDDGTEGLLSLDRVKYEVFEADANTIVAARNENGGVILYANRKVTVIPTDTDVRSVATRNNTSAWLEGQPGRAKLSMATPAVLVSSASGTKFVSGRLVTAKPGSPVYLATGNNERFVFPSEGEFYSWYRDFGSLQVVSGGDMSTLKLAGSVLYPTGSLIKVPSSPRVYSIGSDGALRWVTDGSVLASLYGNNWRYRVRDTSESFLAAYRFGTDVRDLTGFYTAAMAR